MKRQSVAVALLMFLVPLAAQSMETVEQRDAGFDQGIAFFEEGQFQEAVELVQPLAESGHVNAQYQMGLMYSWGAGVPQDEKLSEVWFTRAFQRLLVEAESGDGEAMADVGLMLDEGQGVARNVDAAMSWLQRGVELENASAIAYMGDMYFFGHGVPSSSTEALSWYRQSADLGNDYALTMLTRIEQSQKSADTCAIGTC